MDRRGFLITQTAVLAVAAGFAPLLRAAAKGTFQVVKTDAEWQRQLSAEQFAVLRRDGTERAWTSPLLKESRKGVYTCAGCALTLFASSTKYDSSTGWPSFWAPIESAVGSERDATLGMVRTSVHCSRCGGHLGHVFDDGPKPTGLRYCINGIALGFVAQMS